MEKAERSFEIITNMLKNSESVDKIKLYTGFNKKQIMDIKCEIKSAI